MAASIPMLRVLIQRDSSSKPSQPEFVQLKTTTSTARGTDLLSNDADKKRSTGGSWPGLDVQAVEEVEVRHSDEKDNNAGLAV